MVIDPLAGGPIRYPARRYQDFLAKWVNDFDTIIHLAALSSVAACYAHPVGALTNNLTDLVAFTRTLKHQALIFASTGSLHDRNTRTLYDLTKQAAELVLPKVHPNTHILRLGTVCGVSPVMREDLILNGMTRDAVRTGTITVRNPGAWRPVLFFPDLCAAVDRILAGENPGIHELASFQCRIGGWAEMVARSTGANIVDAEMTPHYDFRMPVLDSVTTPERVIEGLVGYWREKS